MLATLSPESAGYDLLRDVLGTSLSPNHQRNLFIPFLKNMKPCMSQNHRILNVVEYSVDCSTSGNVLSSYHLVYHLLAFFVAAL